MGVRLLLKLIDKANNAYEVGEVGVRAPNVSSAVLCIYSPPYETALSPVYLAVVQPPPPPPMSKQTACTSQIRGWGFAFNPHLSPTSEEPTPTSDAVP